VGCCVEPVGPHLLASAQGSGAAPGGLAPTRRCGRLHATATSGGLNGADLYAAGRHPRRAEVTRNLDSRMLPVPSAMISNGTERPTRYLQSDRTVSQMLAFNNGRGRRWKAPTPNQPGGLAVEHGGTGKQHLRGVEGQADERLQGSASAAMVVAHVWQARRVYRHRAARHASA
jgi:hypothetical protein